MNKEHSILKKWWFVFVITPIFSISLSFIPRWSSTDEKLLTWMILMVISFCCQIYIFQIKKIKYRMMYYFYILSSFMVTIFISFIISKFVSLNFKWNWIENIIQMLLAVAILFIIKTVIWIFMSFKHNQIINKDESIEEMKIRIQKLEDQNNELKEKLDEEDEKDEKQEKPKANSRPFFNFGKK